VLKVQEPHRESEHEADALRLWDGDGAIKLLDEEPDECALLLVSELSLDRERARGWTIGQTIAWAFDGEHRRTHADVARWLVEAS